MDVIEEDTRVGGVDENIRRGREGVERKNTINWTHLHGMKTKIKKKKIHM